MYDLPSEDPEEPGLPDEYHYLQPQLLSATFHLRDYAFDQVFMAISIFTTMFATLSGTSAPTGLLSLMCLGSMSAHGWLRMASSQRLMAPSS